MIFFLIAFFGMYIGRRIGWFVSKNILYQTPLTLCIILCFLWGVLIAYSIHYLIQWQNPNIILKIIMGYCLGGYVASPNNGLIAESTIPESGRLRHELINLIPTLTYLVTLVILEIFF
jgi:hypothetical protein